MKIRICGYIIGVLVLALGLQSCQEQDEVVGSDQYPILFENFQTRALADLDDLKGDGFMVHAYRERNDNPPSFTKKVKYYTDSNVWGFEEVEYWWSGVSYWFTAYYPSTLNGFSFDDATKEYRINTFDIANNQVDVMVASATATVGAYDAAPTAGSTVNLNFEHLLACVEIKMTSEIDNVTINKIILHDVANYCTCIKGTWASAGNETEIESANDVALTKGATDAVDVTNGGIFVIPEKVDGQAVTIQFTAGTNHKSYENIPIPEGTWVKGNKYTYTAVVKQNNIVFSEPTVEKWDSDNATGSVIIK